MLVNANQLKNLATDFSNMGKDYVGVNEQTHRMEQKTQSLGQRFVAWMKSGGATQRAENRDILDNIKMKVSRTLGDRYEAAFQQKIQSSFDSKRPIAGRKIGAALQEVIEMKKNDDAHALQAACQNNRVNVTTSPEARQALQTAIEERAAQYHIDPQQINVEKIQNSAIAGLDVYTGINLQAATPQEIIDKIKSSVHSECENMLRDKSISLAKESQPSALSQIQDSMREHGIQGNISPKFINSLFDKAGAEIMQASKGPNRTILQPTPEQVKAAVTRQVTNVVGSLQEVQASPLNPAGKAAMTRAMLQGNTVISPAIVKVAAQSLVPNGNLDTLSRLFAEARQEKETVSLAPEIMNMQLDFSNAFHGVAGLGGDDSVHVGTLMMDTAMQHQTGGESLPTISGSGALLVRTLYDITLQQENQGFDNIENGGQAGQLSFARNLLASFNNSGNPGLDNLLSNPNKLPLGFSSREHLNTIAQNNGKPSALPSVFEGPDGAKLKKNVLADVRASLKTNSQPEVGAFARDFARSFEVTINGRPQTNIPQNTNNLDSLLPAFGNDRGVMEKVLGQVHQGLSVALFSPSQHSFPELGDLVFGGFPLSQPSRANITSNAHGGYDVHYEVSTQRGDGSAYNMMLEFSIDNLQSTKPTLTVKDLDYSIFNTME